MNQILQDVKIENPRNYEIAVVEGLRQLLKAESRIRRDEHRQDFYEIDGRRETYYIHVSRVTGSVVLLAKWNRSGEVCCREAGCAA